MWNYEKIFKNREIRLKLIGLLSIIPTKPFLKIVYRIKTGEKLNLKNPRGINEKINWLKINDIHLEYTNYVDKIAVRDIITEKLGEEYLIPLLGKWDCFDDIDFDMLPDKFVLKCSHDSGSVKLIKDKNSINKAELRSFFKGRMRTNAFSLGRGYLYRGIKPRILAEKFMESDNGGGINDYKLHITDLLSIPADSRSIIRH
jgi:hypothetical protein